MQANWLLSNQTDCILLWMFIFAKRFECNVELLYISMKTTSLEICLQLEICCWSMNWLISSCLLDAILNFVFSNDALLYKNIFLFFRNQIRIPRTTVRSDVCYFVFPCQVQPSSNKNLLSNWQNCLNDVMKIIDDDFCGRYAPESAISLLAYVSEKIVLYILSYN